jgi:rRNA maturation RNase YbeY
LRRKQKRNRLPKINIVNAYKRSFRPPVKRLKELVKSILNSEGLDYDEITIIFIDDSAIYHINKQFLNHDYPTDVISFDLSDESGKVAEIYISIDRAIQQAKTYKVEFQNELARLTAHGLLHLAGFDDRTRSEKLKMRKIENRYIKLIGF